MSPILLLLEHTCFLHSKTKSRVWHCHYVGSSPTSACSCTPTSWTNGNPLLQQKLNQMMNCPLLFSSIRIQMAISPSLGTFHFSSFSFSWWPPFQEFPFGRPCYNHEWILRIFLHLFVCKVSLDQWHGLLVVCPLVSTRWLNVRLFRWKSGKMEKIE